MAETTGTDRIHLRRAIELASNGNGLVKPNPVVGAVVARGEEIIGEGWHERFGSAHAEINAIEACGLSDLAGASLYVSLEPCCHEGKTPPCTDAILQAGIRRVVIASDDPTEKASGRGMGILRDEGVEIVLADDDIAASARLLNQPFRKHAKAGRPWVLFKSAMSLDGKVATSVGDSKWISGEESRALAHRWRVSLDAVVVGIGTALADDPQLTARPDGSPVELASQPRRVVFDSLARLPVSSKLVSAAREIPLILVVSRAAARAETDALEAAGVQVLVATGENEPARVRSALDQLGAFGVTSLLLEGGPHLAGAFLDAGEIDEVRLFLAPILLGGRTARDPLEGEGVERISEAIEALTFDSERVGKDLLVTARLREW
ncbi:MAG TPA: bifunctional diaminohydroxyphosphoribosylaminopyrimidine deaminase/5-amino-6-(5-phosphoribosylamino)uracil reductase RibD [Solirubrobacteraceae bacterium]